MTPPSWLAWLVGSSLIGASAFMALFGEGLIGLLGIHLGLSLVLLGWWLDR